MDKERFIEELKLLNVEINDCQLKQLEEYYQLLISWNEKMNLTGITEKKDVYLKHFYDSATLCKGIDLHKELSLCDIGTGAGFPGLVLKILFPSLHITLIDSLQKRIVFLEEVIRSLNLSNIEVFNKRAEEYASKVREKFDIVTSRAVAPLSILMEYSIPLVKTNGYFIPMKSHCESEVEHIKKACSQLNVELKNICTFSLPIENSTRTLLVFEKIKKTSLEYPRKYSEIKKNPL